MNFEDLTIIYKRYSQTLPRDSAIQSTVEEVIRYYQSEEGKNALRECPSPNLTPDEIGDMVSSYLYTMDIPSQDTPIMETGE